MATAAPKSAVPPGKANGARDRRKELLEQEVLEAACLLFAEKGYAGTTLTDIAEAVGLTRAALYYYFKNKEALLEAIMREISVSALADIQEWRRTAPSDPTERWRSFVAMRAAEAIRRRTQLRMLAVTEAALPPAMRKKHDEAKDAIFEEYVALVRAGVASGAFRPVDETSTVFAVVGMITWANNLFPSAGEPEPEKMVAEIAELAVQAVRAPDGPPPAASAEAALDVVRKDLDRLAHLLARDAEAAPEKNSKTENHDHGSS